MDDICDGIGVVLHGFGVVVAIAFAVMTVPVWGPFWGIGVCFNAARGEYPQWWPDWMPL